MSDIQILALTDREALLDLMAEAHWLRLHPKREG